MGRKPKPTFLKKITGNPGRRPLPENEPVVSEPLGCAPASWKADAKKVWAEIEKLIPFGVATKADRLLVEILARLILRVRTNPERLNPATASQIRACLCALGMTPADRAKFVVPPDHSIDPAEKYLR